MIAWRVFVRDSYWSCSSAVISVAVVWRSSRSQPARHRLTLVVHPRGNVVGIVSLEHSRQAISDMISASRTGEMILITVSIRPLSAAFGLDPVIVEDECRAQTATMPLEPLRTSTI